jgi:hydrogenase/urease accessory protein HupE
MLTLILLTPVAMAHSGVHGADGFIVALLHQLTAADHWLIFFVLFLFVGLFISATRRSIVKK